MNVPDNTRIAPESQAGAVGRDYLAASLAMADAIETHEFGLRERLALGLVRQLSFGANQPEAYIPGWRYWATALRVSEGNCCTIVRGLMRQQVIEESQQHCFGFRLPAENWKVAPRTEAIEVIRQLELIERPASLRSAMRETFVERFAVPCMNAPATASAAGAPFPNREAFLNREAHKTFPIREGPIIPHGDGQIESIPDSGRFRHVGHDHVPNHAPNSMLHGTMLHAVRVRSFDVGAATEKTGEELLALVIAVAGALKPEYVEQWARRIGEDAVLVWEIACEAKQRHDLTNPAGWLNRAYLKARRIEKHVRQER